MARIQVLPLPPVKNGDYERTPFILILDRLDDPMPHAVQDHLRAASGADLVVTSMGEIEAPGQFELTDEQRDALTQYLTGGPRRYMLGVNGENEDAAWVSATPAPQPLVTDLRYTDAHDHLTTGKPLDAA